MADNYEQILSPRERQMMDIIFKLGKATAAEIQAEMESPPTNAAVRRILGILVEKGFLRHDWDGPRYVYTPLVDRDSASRTALARVTNTFFDGSPVQTVATLLDMSASRLTEADLAELSRLIEKAREEDN